METLGLRLKMAREESGMTAQQVADALGVHYGTVFRWEADDPPPSLERARQLAKLYRVPLSRLTVEADTADALRSQMEKQRRKILKMEKEIADLRKLIQERLSGPGEWRLKRGRIRTDMVRDLREATRTLA